MTEEKKYFTYIDTVTGNKDMEKIIIDGVNVAGCRYYHYKGCTANNFGKCDSCSEIYKNCYYKQLQRLKQENRELSKLIRGTKDYAEVCSVCKDEVTIYPNISGRTDYTQNEVECRTLAQIITQKNNLEQENKELKEKINAFVEHSKTESDKVYYKMLDYKTALEETRNLCNKGAGVYTNAKVVGLINEVLNEQNN